MQHALPGLSRDAGSACWDYNTPAGLVPDIQASERLPLLSTFVRADTVLMAEVRTGLTACSAMAGCSAPLLESLGLCGQPFSPPP